jgi:hypothetical protein
MRVDEDTIIDRLRDEEEERRLRNIEPHVIAEQVVEDDGKINFRSLIYGREDDASGESSERGTTENGLEGETI